MLDDPYLLVVGYALIHALLRLILPTINNKDMIIQLHTFGLLTYFLLLVDHALGSTFLHVALL